MRKIIATGLLGGLLMAVALGNVRAGDLSPEICEALKQARKVYSEADLIAMAKARGRTEKEIAQARRCLRS